MLSDALWGRVPPYKCPVCGSTCFRDETFVELPESGCPDDLEYHVRYPKRVLVCLCGRPVSVFPLESHHLNQTTPNGRFLNSLQQSEEYGKSHARFRDQVAVERAELPVLQERVRKLEEAIGPLLAQQGQAHVQRETKGRQWLAGELQKKGLTYRKARAAVGAVVQVIREGLRKEGLVKTPIGRFYSKPRTPSYDRQRWEGKQTLHKEPIRVVFKPKRGLLDGETTKSKKTNKKGQHATNPK